jgi:hypothetical protein
MTVLKKMSTTLSEPIEYCAEWAPDNSVNKLIGKKFQIQFTGNLFCQVCTKKTKKFFGEGFCYSCFISSSQASPCILRPELCKAHLGEGRDSIWEENHHNQPHIVYLAQSDCVKVGVTRSTQVPTRWIDQGARSAIFFAETANRFEAGVLEVTLKSFFSDKTNYKKMLQNEIDESIDLVEEKWNMADNLPQDFQSYISENDFVTDLIYPVTQYPSTPKLINLEKINLFEGVVTGIKGQYLLFENDFALNIRRHTGFEVEFSF